MKKTNKSVAKRFKKTGTGKLRHSKTCRSHLLTKKGRKTKRDKFGKELSSAREIRKMKSLLPYA